MSLINEALRKARKEAAERDAEERGVSYRPPRSHLPTERSWLPALAGVALGAVLAAAAFWLLLPRSSPTDDAHAAHAESDLGAAPTKTQADETGASVAEVQTGSEPEPVVETAIEKEPEQEPEEELEKEPAAAATVAQKPPPVARDPEPVEEPGQPAVAESVDPDEPVVEAAPAEPGPAPPSSDDQVRRVEPAGQVGQVGAAVYVLEATVDGVDLRLDFIVWSASPFAQINGRQVAVGQSVEGFLVRDISREEVTLEGEGGRFRLRVR